MDHTTLQIPEWNIAPKEAEYFLAAQPNEWYATYHKADGNYLIADHHPKNQHWNPYNPDSDRYKRCVKILRQPLPNFDYAPADATHFGWETDEYNAGWYKLDSRGIWHFLGIHAKPGTKWHELDEVDDDTSDEYIRYMNTFVPRSHVFAPKPDGAEQSTPENDIDSW